MAAVSAVRISDVPIFGAMVKKPNTPISIGKNFPMGTVKGQPQKPLILKKKQASTKDLIILNQKKRDLRSIEEIQLELKWEKAIRSKLECSSNKKNPADDDRRGASMVPQLQAKEGSVPLNPKQYMRKPERPTFLETTKPPFRTATGGGVNTNNTVIQRQTEASAKLARYGRSAKFEQTNGSKALEMVH